MLGDQLDPSHDARVNGGQVLGRDPVLQDRFTVGFCREPAASVVCGEQFTVLPQRRLAFAGRLARIGGVAAGRGRVP
jgi:hypothetical protein